MSTSTATTTVSLTDQLKDDSMSLEDKLKAIDAAMAAAQQQAADDQAQGFSTAAPFDPADLTICDSCQ